MAEHNELGRWGEQKAAEYLRAKGYVILERDWKFQKRDLDIVALKDGTIAFVEVKTRRNDIFLRPEQSVDRRKMMSICIAANAYVRWHRIEGNIRFDIISIVGTSEDNFTIDHIENAFLPPTIRRR